MGHGRWSLLQALIITETDKYDIYSISDLARRLNRARRSVSRSVHLLEQRGLLINDGHCWRPANSMAVAQAIRCLANAHSRAKQDLERASRRIEMLAVWHQ